MIIAVCYEKLKRHQLASDQGGAGGKAMPSTADELAISVGKLPVRLEGLQSLLTANPEDPDAVAEAVQLCPSLTSRVLAVTNSAAFGLRWTVSSVQHATNLLSARQVRSLSLAHALRMMTESSDVPQPILDAVWFSSVQKACAARIVCQKFDTAQAEYAYGLALVQDVGLPPMIGLGIDQYVQMCDAVCRGSHWTEEEHTRFGFEHGEVGAALMKRWGASEEMQAALEDHHHPPKKMESTGDGLLQLGLFTASLLPHVDEPMINEQQQWLHAIYSRFLADEFNSPEDFIVRVGVEAEQITGGSINKDQLNNDELLMRVAADVSETAVPLIVDAALRQRADDGSEEEFNKLREDAFTDSLTKVLNRRGFYRLAERRLNTAASNTGSLCCFMFDLNKLKPINDKFGHDCGDQLLRGFAKALRRMFDSRDLIGRIGGDEFAVLLADVTLQQTRQIAERVHEKLTRITLKLKPDMHVRLSSGIGVVVVEQDAAFVDLNNLLREADGLMYQAKRDRSKPFVLGTWDPQAELGQAKAVVCETAD